MSEGPPTPARPPARWASPAVRAAGLWILAGCAAKAFLGTPADLPTVVQRAPFPIGTTFAAVLAVEAFVGLATLLRPGRAWPLAALLLLAFSFVLAATVAAGDASCGCFGTRLPAPPLLMLGVDAALLGLLLGARPWRLPRGGRADALALVAALVLAAAMPLAVRRGGGPADDWVGSRDVAAWRGSPLAETPLARWTDLSQARDGVWLVYRESCEVCADCLQRMAAFEVGNREVTLLRLLESGKPRHVHVLPKGPWVHHADLAATVPLVKTPVRLIVENGVVTAATTIESGDECP